MCYPTVLGAHRTMTNLNGMARAWANLTRIKNSQLVEQGSGQGSRVRWMRPRSRQFSSCLGLAYTDIYFLSRTSFEHSKQSSPMWANFSG